MPNAKILSEKQAIVADLTEKIQGAAGGVLVDYKGITVAEDTALRAEMRKNGVDYAVVKNTLTRFAVKNAGLEELSSVLEGTTSLAVSATDPVAPARVVSEVCCCNACCEAGSSLSISQRYPPSPRNVKSTAACAPAAELQIPATNQTSPFRRANKAICPISLPGSTIVSSQTAGMDLTISQAGFASNCSGSTP